jgi:TATA-box binding protein (TBP) (component of TFIID and TFIIIB)
MNKQLMLKSVDGDAKILKFLQMLENKDNIGEAPKPTMLRISTRSAISKFSSKVDLFKVFIMLSKNILNNIVLGKNPKYLIKCICMSNYKLITIKGHKKWKHNNITVENIDKILEDLKENTRGHFYNQCSIIIKPDQDRRPINIKLFTNGSISMTGCLFNEDGSDAVKILLDELSGYRGVFVDDEVEVVKYAITMINSDFKLKFKVNRYELHDRLVNLGLLSNYDSENYPGVKISYFWNYYDGKRNKGMCSCTKKCIGKGDGTGNGKCKRVTVSIFASGSVIITGANSEKQIIDVYKQINKYIKSMYKDIIQLSITDFMGNK